MSPEEKQCIVRIIHLLHSKRYTARELVRECERNDSAAGFKGHSSRTVYKAIHYLEHFRVIRKRRGEPNGRGRPPMIYELRRTDLEVPEKDRDFRVGEHFALAMFKSHQNLESALAGFGADSEAFYNVFLKTRIVDQLKNLPFDPKEKTDSVKRTLHQTIDLGCEELKVETKKYVDLILEKFGTCNHVN